MLGTLWISLSHPTPTTTFCALRWWRLCDDEWYFLCHFSFQYSKGWKSLLNFLGNLFRAGSVVPFLAVRNLFPLQSRFRHEINFRALVLNFTYRILNQRPGMASDCHHHSNRMFHRGIGIYSFSSATHFIASSFSCASWCLHNIDKLRFFSFPAFDLI